MDLQSQPDPSTSGPEDDYRASHVGKGKDYDRDLRTRLFDLWMTGQELKILDRVVRELFPAGAPRSLDFACGTGRITQVLEGLSRECYGVDISPTMLAEAKRKCSRTHFVEADITRQPSPIPPVSVATAFRFLGNAQDELRSAALAAIHRQLEPGGYLVADNHRNAWSLHQVLLRTFSMGASMDLTPLKLKRLLRRAGFRIVRTYGIGVWFVAWRLDRQSVFRSPLIRLVERLSRIPPFNFVSPDVIVVAQKR